MGKATYLRQLRIVKARLAAVDDHPRLAEVIFHADAARSHQLRTLTDRADDLES